DSVADAKVRTFSDYFQIFEQLFFEVVFKFLLKKNWSANILFLTLFSGFQCAYLSFCECKGRYFLMHFPNLFECFFQKKLLGLRIRVLRKRFIAQNPLQIPQLIILIIQNTNQKQNEKSIFQHADDSLDGIQQPGIGTKRRFQNPGIGNL
ncbi:MAG: hypothetical protein MJZ66_09670, partial [Bacteroidales bacterium]|nr:hypothetical protein [Bacteroidales bacterium]